MISSQSFLGSGVQNPLPPRGCPDNHRQWVPSQAYGQQKC